MEQHLNLPSRIFMYSICTSIEYDLKNHILKYSEDLEINEEMREKTNQRLNLNKEEVNNHNIIDMLDLGDYITIINESPERYKINLYNLKKLKQYFLKIIPIRNRVMHTKPLELGDKATLQEAMENIDIDIKFIEWKEVKKTRDLLKNNPEELLIKFKPNKFEDNYYHNLPEPEFDDTGYIGRKKEQAEIKELLIEDKYPVISIIGNGGIGKTAIIVKVLYELKELPNNPYEAIIWISLKTRTLSNGDFIEIKDSIKNTSQLLKHTEKQVIFDEKLSAEENVLKFMSSFKTLLVIDNLETINDEDISHFIKSIPKESKVLITSRTGLGELEYRYKLEGMNKSDSIQYYRELSKYYGVELHKRSDNEINRIVENVLYSNPLSIKWYITGVFNGIREEELQNSKNNLIEFCMSNVYEKLSDESKEILRLFQIEDYEMSYGEIAYYINKDDIAMKKAINELISTNMITLKNRTYQINMMAKDYLQIIQKIDADFVKAITDKKRKLNGMLQNITVKKQNLKLDPSTILYDFEDKDKKIAAIYLQKALEKGKDKNLEEALSFINKAEEIAPNYFECYKVKAFLNANFKNLLEAIKNYQIAISKCKTDLEYATVYYVYASFYTVVMNDNEKAYELIKKASEYIKDDIEINLQTARILSRLGRFQEAEHILLSIKYEDIESDKIRNIRAKAAGDLYRLWAGIYEPRDEDAKLDKITKGINSIVELKKVDKKTYATLLALLKELSYMFYNDRALKLLLKTLKENLSDLRSLTGNDMKYIEKTISSHKNEIDSSLYNEILKYVIDYTKISKNITDDNLGIVTYISKRFGFISNRKNKSIYFTKNNVKRHIDMGEIVQFDTYTNDMGIGAMNIRKTNKNIEDFYNEE